MRRSNPSLKIIGVLFAAILIGGFIPIPYVVQSPGPTFNTIGEFDGQQLIEIQGERDFPTEGNLDMTTVMISGGPGRDITSADAFAAIFDSSRDVVPRSLLYPEQTTREQVDDENQTLMDHSQMDAVAAALHEMGIDYTRKFVVQGFSDFTEADGLLREEDEILTAEGKDISGVVGLRQQLAEIESDTIELGFLRDGEEKTADVPIVTDEAGSRVIGVFLSNSYEFPFDVDVSLDDVGGPSAGLMFSLAIVDKLTPESLTGGKHFAGTGTIDADGTVGAIGGIPQKVVGAKEMGADYFLAPQENCEELSGRVPDGLTVIAVEKLSQARKIVEQIGESSNPEELVDELPRCR